MTPRVLKFRAWDGNQIVHSVDLSQGNGLEWLGVYDWPLMQFTGVIASLNFKEIYEGDIISFELGFQSGDFTGNYQGIQGYHSENGFYGIVDFDADQRFEWIIKNIKFEKAITDADYVFRMNKDSWTKDQLVHYCNIKRKPLREAKKIKVIGNIYETI